MAAARKAAILPEAPPTRAAYDAGCRRCARLATFLDDVRADQSGLLLPAGAAVRRPGGPRSSIVGLAPGMHGANASGRPFTGDHAGILLYATLHAYGFASHADGAARDDGLALTGCRITNAVKCLPPQNKPAPAEIRQCNDYLAADLAALPAGGAILALGRIAHEAMLRALGGRPAEAPFAHGARHPLARRARAVRQLPLQPLQHEHAAADARRCSARSSTAIAAHLGSALPRPRIGMNPPAR